VLNAAPALPIPLYVFLIGRAIYSGNQQTGDILVVPLLCIASIVFISVWLSGFKIEIRQNDLYYRTGFSKTYRLKLTDIEKAELEFVNKEHSRRGIPVLSLVITDCKQEKHCLNIKPFPIDDIQQLLSLLNKDKMIK
jgi:hypothetical protein